MTRDRNAKRREDDAAYERESELRNSRAAEFRHRFGTLMTTLEGLGIDPHELVDFVSEKGEL